MDDADVFVARRLSLAEKSLEERQVTPAIWFGWILSSRYSTCGNILRRSSSGGYAVVRAARNGLVGRESQLRRA